MPEYSAATERLANELIPHAMLARRRYVDLAPVSARKFGAG
ncbi:hypothetical protein [Nocardioides sp. YIM 152588]